MNIKPVITWIDRLRDNLLPLIVMWALVQSLAGIWWAASLQGRIATVELINAQQSARMDYFDIHGTSQIAVIVERQNRNTAAIDQLMGTSASLLRMQGQLDVANNDMKRLGEQQMRIISALDNVYSELQQFMRGNPSPRAPPLNLPPPDGRQ